MKTQPISEQNFTGKLKFARIIDSNGRVDDLKKILAPQIDDATLITLKQMIANKPYDLFISRAKNMRGFYSVDANTDFANVIGSNEAKKGYPSLVYAGRLERFVSAAYEAMNSFEKAPEYENLTKPVGFFKTVYNFIFK